MGTARARLKRPFHHSWPMQVVVLFTMVFLIATPAWCRSCKVEQCWTQYSRTLEQEQVVQGPTRAYCVALKAHAECIRGTARGCRGDLAYHSTSSLVSQWTNEFNCSHVIMHAASAPPAVTRGRNPGGGGGGGGGGAPTACAYNGVGGTPLHCSLFGDPHLRTFDDRVQTCRVLGAWPLVDNAYLAVQVTNEAVVPGSSVTATTKVTVVVKGADAAQDRNPCAQPRTYEAQADQPLPSAFVDGTTGGGHERSVRVKEREDGAVVEITLRYAATTVLVRRVGRYLSVAVRMPRDVAHAGRLSGGDAAVGSAAGNVPGGGGSGSGGLQLCLNGCPQRERIDYKAALLYPDRRNEQTTLVMDREQALATCAEYGVTDFYLDACVFDLMKTGDAEFAQAAKKALHDLRTLNPSLANSLANRTSVWAPGDSVGSELDMPTSVIGGEEVVPPSRGGGGGGGGLGQTSSTYANGAGCRSVRAETAVWTTSALCVCLFWWWSWSLMTWSVSTAGQRLRGRNSWVAGAVL